MPFLNIGTNGLSVYKLYTSTMLYATVTQWTGLNKQHEWYNIHNVPTYRYISYIHRAIWNDKTMHKGITWMYHVSQKEYKNFDAIWIINGESPLKSHIHSTTLNSFIPLNTLGILFNMLGITIQYAGNTTMNAQVDKLPQIFTNYRNDLHISQCGSLYVCMYAFGFSSCHHYSTIIKLIHKKTAVKPRCNIMLKSCTGSNLFLPGDITSIQLCLVPTMPRVQLRLCQYCIANVSCM